MFDYFLFIFFFYSFFFFFFFFFSTSLLILFVSLKRKFIWILFLGQQPSLSPFGPVKKKKKIKRKFTSGIGQEPKAPSPLLPTYRNSFIYLCVLSLFMEILPFSLPSSLNIGESTRCLPWTPFGRGIWTNCVYGRDGLLQWQGVEPAMITQPFFFNRPKGRQWKMLTKE